MKHINHLITSGLILLFFLILSQPTLAQEDHGIHVGGYGELHYNDVVYDANGEETAGTLDFHRFALLFGYDFNDWISFNSEVELEHTLLETAEGGEIALKQAYIDLALKQALGIRAGLMLVPVGIVNTEAEPNTFYSVERPTVEETLIPSTWSESGVGIYGNTSSGLSYQAYLMAGLAPNGIDGREGITGATQNGFKSSTANLALTGRLDYQFNHNFTAGASYFYSSLNNTIEEGKAEKISALDKANLNLAEIHAIYETERFEARGLFSYSHLAEAESINNTFNNDAGESQLGGYVTLAYDMLPSLAPATSQQLYIFGRYGSFDTQYTTKAIPDNPEFHRTDYTFGLSYFPIEEVAFKADYQILTSAGDKSIRQLNLGVAYEF